MTQQVREWCDFCVAFARTGDIGMTPEFEKMVGSHISRTIFETEHFAVIASLGQIVEGYLLVLSKDHYPSIAHVPLTLYEELSLVYLRAKRVLSRCYSAPFIFEHGPMPEKEPHGELLCSGGACVEHAHLHFIPLPVSSDPIVFRLKEELPWRPISQLVDIRIQAKRRMPYFFVETENGERYIFDAPIAPSQYLRRLVAVLIGKPKRWNWRQYPGAERVINTVSRLRACKEKEEEV